MRDSVRDRGLAASLSAALLIFGLLLAGCGTAAVTPSPTPTPTPTPTPDPHLVAPASVDDVFAALTSAGLKITANNADSGGASGEPRKRLNTTYAGWPLILSEYGGVATLQTNSTFKPDTIPGVGSAPYNIVGLNILVEYGPHAKNKQTVPDPSFVAAAQALVDTLDPLLSPLSQSSVQPLVLPQAAQPSTSPAPASGAPASAPVPSPSS